MSGLPPAGKLPCTIIHTMYNKLWRNCRLSTRDLLQELLDLSKNNPNTEYLVTTLTQQANMHDRVDHSHPGPDQSASIPPNPACSHDNNPDEARHRSISIDLSHVKSPPSPSSSRRILSSERPVWSAAVRRRPDVFHGRKPLSARPATSRDHSRNNQRSKNGHTPRQPIVYDRAVPYDRMHDPPREVYRRSRTFSNTHSRLDDEALDSTTPTTGAPSPAPVRFLPVAVQELREATTVQDSCSASSTKQQAKLEDGAPDASVPDLEAEEKLDDAAAAPRLSAEWLSDESEAASERIAHPTHIEPAATESSQVESVMPAPPESHLSAALTAQAPRWVPALASKAPPLLETEVPIPPDSPLAAALAAQAPSDHGHYDDHSQGTLAKPDRDRKRSVKEPKVGTPSSMTRNVMDDVICQSPFSAFVQRTPSPALPSSLAMRGGSDK